MEPLPAIRKNWRGIIGFHCHRGCDLFHRGEFFASKVGRCLPPASSAPAQRRHFAPLRQRRFIRKLPGYLMFMQFS
jgi:hypothetical protein